MINLMNRCRRLGNDLLFFLLDGHFAIFVLNTDLPNITFVDDLKADSLDVFQIITEIEDQFEIQISGFGRDEEMGTSLHGRQTITEVISRRR